MPIDRNGPVVRGTRRNLIIGVRARPMREEAVDAALEQAGAFTEKLVDTYESQVAQGEVGSDGIGRATGEPIIGERPPTALLYGRVQSGKTAAMVLTSALCLDNGFKVIVVLTADNLALVDQTAKRFKALQGPRVFSTNKDGDYEWRGQEEELRRDVARDGVVLVCAKDSFHLREVLQFFQDIEAANYPALIFDDEADAATPDTTLEARTSGRPNAPPHSSTINRRVIENTRPGEEGESVNETFPHSLFVQVTATPYVLFLQRSDSRLRPDFTFLLEPGQGYLGGTFFFDRFDPTVVPAASPLVIVHANESARAVRREAPAGLASSVEYFLVAAAAHALADGRWPDEGFKHLSHTSPRIGEHTVVANLIERRVNELRRQLMDRDAALRTFAAAHTELMRTFPNAPSLADLIPGILDAVLQADFVRVNSQTAAPAYGPRANFLIGGNILGRGLTIDDLLVTYYVREAQTPQMDTVWQHARMYGYRQHQSGYLRLFLTARGAARFQQIHKSEEALRTLARRREAGEDVPIRVAVGTRATRRNATEPGVLRVYRQQVAPRRATTNPGVATEIRAMLVTAGVPLDERARDRRSTIAPIELVLELIEKVPVSANDSGDWDADAALALIETFREKMNGRGRIYVRSIDDATGDRTRARLAGPEVTIIQAAAGEIPTLVLMFDGDVDSPTAWYPTLVLPDNTTNYVVNPE